LLRLLLLVPVSWTSEVLVLGECERIRLKRNVAAVGRIGERDSRQEWLSCC